MNSKTIKISKENYDFLLSLASVLQKRYGRIATFDDAITVLKKEKKHNLRSLAGSWNISESKSKEFLNEIYSSRKVISRRI